MKVKQRCDARHLDVSSSRQAPATFAMPGARALAVGPELYRAASRLARRAEAGAAWSCARAGLAYCRVVGDASGEAAFSLALGRLAWCRHLPEATIALLDAGIRRARRSGDRIALFHLLSSGVAAEIALGERERALERCREAGEVAPTARLKVRNLVLQAALAASAGTERGIQEGRRLFRRAHAIASRQRRRSGFDRCWAVEAALGSPRALSRILPTLAEALL